MITALVIDLDNVLADSMSKFCRLASKEMGRSITLRDIKSHKVVGSITLSYDRISQLQLAVWNDWRDIQSCELNTARYASDISEGGTKITVCTSRPGYDHSNQEAWLKNQGIPYNEFRVISPYSHKSTVEGDTLIDDAPEEVEYWINEGRRGFIYNRPWNDRKFIARAIRISTLKEARDNIAKLNQTRHR